MNHRLGFAVLFVIPLFTGCQYIPPVPHIPHPQPTEDQNGGWIPGFGTPGSDEMVGYYFKPGIPWVGQATDGQGRTWQVRLVIKRRDGGQFSGTFHWLTYHNKTSHVDGTIFGNQVTFTEKRNWNNPQMTNGTHHEGALAGKVLRGHFRGGPDRMGGTFELRASGQFAE